MLKTYVRIRMVCHGEKPVINIIIKLNEVTEFAIKHKRHTKQIKTNQLPLSLAYK